MSDIDELLKSAEPLRGTGGLVDKLCDAIRQLRADLSASHAANVSEFKRGQVIFDNRYLAGPSTALDLIKSHRAQSKLIEEQKRRIKWLEDGIPVKLLNNYAIAFPTSQAT